MRINTLPHEAKQPLPLDQRASLNPLDFRSSHASGRTSSTGQTHEERQQARALRAEQERKAYLIHVRARQAMIRAIETGEPQFLYKDSQGRDVYIEAPHDRMRPEEQLGTIRMPMARIRTQIPDICDRLDHIAVSIHVQTTSEPHTDNFYRTLWLWLWWRSWCAISCRISWGALLGGALF